MKASELRIGNWLYSGITKENFVIDGYDILNIDEGDDEGKTKPIELTEEWLFRCGFEKTNEVWYIKDHLEISLSGLFSFTWLNDLFTLRYKLSYVHQLQNLYFALTGEELKYNEL
jgi:hypothetical protein